MASLQVGVFVSRARCQTSPTRRKKPVNKDREFVVMSENRELIRSLLACWMLASRQTGTEEQTSFNSDERWVLSV